MKRRKPETDAQFIKRIDRTQHRLVKDGGPTREEIVRAIHIKLASHQGKGRS